MLSRRMNLNSTQFILKQFNQTHCKTSAFQIALETIKIPLQMQRTIADYEGIVLDHPGSTRADIESVVEEDKELISEELYSSYPRK